MARIPRIFVSIASYRDPQCQWTVKDLFDKAMRPERVFVGICWQYDPERDQDCFQVPYPRPAQVRSLVVNWRDAKGVSWARHEIQKLWQGEEYVLQIDAHMRFVIGWDVAMIQELKLCDSPKPLLSCYPPPFTPPNDLPANPKLNVCTMQSFQPDGNLRGKSPEIGFVPEKPMRGAFVMGAFIFARSRFFEEIPYDPYLYFDQEEITLAIRLFTHGWDVFSSHRTLLYHYYYDPAKIKRETHLGDFYKEEETANKMRWFMERGTKRFNHLTGYELSDDPDVTAELDKYGFGNVRTLQAFEVFTGIDFNKKTVSKKTTDGLFVDELRQRIEASQQQTPAAVAGPPGGNVPTLPSAGGAAPSS